MGFIKVCVSSKLVMLVGNFIIENISKDETTTTLTPALFNCLKSPFVYIICYFYRDSGVLKRGHNFTERHGVKIQSQEILIQSPRGSSNLLSFRLIDLKNTESFGLYQTGWPESQK